MEIRNIQRKNTVRSKKNLEKKKSFKRDQLIIEQGKDADLSQIMKRALPLEELEKVSECFYFQNGARLKNLEE